MWKSRQAEDAPLGQRAREFFQFIKFPGQITAANQRADRGSRDHADLDAGFVQRTKDPDMGPAASSTTAQRERDRCATRRHRDFGGRR